VYHAIGTCAMGPDDADVVDPAVRVRGVENLRIMDCSVLPIMVAGNLNGPMMAMASRAADLILEARCPLTAQPDTKPRLDVHAFGHHPFPVLLRDGCGAQARRRGWPSSESSKSAHPPARRRASSATS